jgi:tetratricopeptide (TPR) repeat protein
MWSETFERDRADILAVENEIDRAIAGRLVTSGASKGRAIEPRAHEAYLQGRYWFNRRSPAELWRAIGYFNQALERDPVYAEAYLGLADAFAVLGANDQAPSQDVFPKARAAAERALELDDGLGEAHATLAHVVSFYDWNFPRAEQEFKRAIELRPNYAAGHQWYGLLLMYQGRFDEAAKELNAAKDLDPLSLVIPLGLGRVYFYSGNYDRSLELSRSLLRYDDNFALTHDSLGQAYQRKGDYKRAVEEFQKYLRLSGQDPDALMNLGETYALAGEREQALGILRQLQSLRLGYSSPYDYAVIYASLGDKEQAYRWLDKSVEEHSSSCVLMFVDPAFRSFHSDARFQQLLRRTGHGNVEANGSAAGVRRTTA